MFLGDRRAEDENSLRLGGATSRITIGKSELGGVVLEGSVIDMNSGVDQEMRSG